MMTVTTPTVLDRITGRARYASDLAARNTVVAGFARSPYPHARVTGINTKGALKVDGVLAVLTPADFEGIKLGHQKADEPVLSLLARYVGDGVAAVAATSPEALARGIDALEIEYQVLPHALTVDDALRLAVPLHESCADNIASAFLAERGDWDEVCARVTVWVDDTFETEAVPHAYLEPRSTLVRVHGDRLELVTGAHSPQELLQQYRPVVESWGTSLEVLTPAIGGSFGAKWEHPSHLVSLAFANRLGRDVAMVESRRDDMIAGRTRLAMRIRMRLGATADGQLLAKQTELWADNGAYSGHGPTVAMAAAIRMDNLYRFDATKAAAQLVYTNNVPSECFRGFGSPQSGFAQEQLMDRLARRLDLDPFELRRRNVTQTGDTTIHGWQIGSCGIKQCLDAVSVRLNTHRKQLVAPDEARYRIGYGSAACIHGISNRGYDKRFDGANVTLRVERDGTLRIGSGEVELGCGTVDVLKAVISRELGVDPDGLQVVLGDTQFGPFGLGSFASRTTFFAGRAALDACERLRTACTKLAADCGRTDATIPQAIGMAIAENRESELAVTGCYEPDEVSVPDDSGFGNISPAYTFGAHGCCVQVDTFTGKTTVLQYWAAHDAGKILNPSGAIGQVIGGVLQGIGLALAEVVAVDAEGRMLNPGYLDDRVATFPDAVPVDVVFVDTIEDAGPSGAKTIAEPPLIPVAATVANAIRDATGLRQQRLPMTPERVWQNLSAAPNKRGKNIG